MGFHLNKQGNHSGELNWSAVLCCVFHLFSPFVHEGLIGKTFSSEKALVVGLERGCLVSVSLGLLIAELRAVTAVRAFTH